MDFGIDRLIDMFEERFGKPAATALLAIIGLGAAGWGIRSVWSNMVRPSISAGASIYSEIAHPSFHWHSVVGGSDIIPFLHSWNGLFAYFYGVFAALLSIFVVSRLVRRVFGTRAGAFFYSLVGAPLEPTIIRFVEYPEDPSPLKYPQAEPLPVPTQPETPQKT